MKGPQTVPYLSLLFFPALLASGALPGSTSPFSDLQATQIIVCGAHKAALC